MQDQNNPHPRRSRRSRRIAVVSGVALAAAVATGVLAVQGLSDPSPDTDPPALVGADVAQAEAAPAPRLAPSSSAPAPPSASASSAPASSAPAAKPKPKPKPKPPASKILDYEYQAQINGYYCGPAATRIALTAKGKEPSQDSVANQLNTTINGTDSAMDTTRVLNKVIGTTFYRTRTVEGGTSAETERLRSDVVRAVTSGYAPVVNIAGYAVDTEGGSHSFPGGHYVTVVGYRDSGRTVKIADPANPAVSSYWMTTANMADWAVGHGYSA